MNKIMQWASLLVEELDEPSYNDVVKLQSVYGKTEDDMTPEDYAKLSDEEKEELHQTAKNAKRDPEIDDMSDEEVDRMMKKSDAFLKSLDNRDENGDEKKTTFVFICESVYLPNNSKKNELLLKKGISSREEFMQLDPGKFEIDRQETKEFPSIDEAKKFVESRMVEMGSKYGAKLEDFETVDIEALPTEVRKEDPNAIGFVFTKSEGENKKYELRGQQKTDDMSKYDFKFDKLTKTIFLEYFIYSAKARIKGSDHTADIFKAMAGVED